MAISDFVPSKYKLLGMAATALLTAGVNQANNYFQEEPTNAVVEEISSDTGMTLLVDDVFDEIANDLVSSERDYVQKKSKILIESKNHIERSRRSDIDKLFGNDSVLEVNVEKRKAKILGTNYYRISQSKIDSHQYEKRNILENLIKRMTTFDSMFNTAENFSLSKRQFANRLIHYGLIAQESGARLKAKSPTGPIGVCQYTYNTGIEQGNTIEVGIIDERLNPNSLVGCLRYLENFKNELANAGVPTDYRFLVAAYNWGPSNVIKHFKKGFTSFSYLQKLYDKTGNVKVGEVMGHMVGIKAYAEIFNYSSMSDSQKNHRAKIIQKELDHAKRSEKQELKNNLLALKVSFTYSPQWSMATNSKYCHYLKKGDSLSRFGEWGRAFNPEVETNDINLLLKGRSGVCYVLPPKEPEYELIHDIFADNK